MTPDQIANFQIAGNGNPTILFVHGLGCDLDDWTLQLRELSGEFRCIALDLPGHGRSVTTGATSLAAMGAEVLRVVSHIGAKDVILVGHSLGSKVIREAYFQNSDNIQGLVLVDGRLSTGDRQTMFEKTQQTIDRLGFSEFLRWQFGGMFVEGCDEQTRERVLARALKMNPDLGRKLYLDSIEWDFAKGDAALTDIAVPILLLQSTYINSDLRRVSLQEGMTTPFMDAASRLAAKSESRVIEGCGHFPMLDAPEATSQAIREFARRVAH